MKGSIHWQLGFALAAMTILVTGCPYNQYIVDATPHGDVLERTLTFYCEDGVNPSNGVPNYHEFPTNELKFITALYPAGAISTNGNRLVARGSFAGSLPGDLGGAGYYSNYTTSLGSATLYAERFRGSDDLATTTEKRLRAADVLVDHVVAWSKMELGNQPHYADLRDFLEHDFRRDVKNASIYWWLGGVFSEEKTNGAEEYVARGGQYLVEHGYLKLGDLPELVRGFEENDDNRINRLVQRLVARKLGIPDSRPIPKALAFLGDANATEASWEKYLVTTPEYRHLLWQWRKQRLEATWLNPGYVAHNAGRALGASVTNAPGPPRPQPTVVTDPIYEDLLQTKFWSQPDAVTVNLDLPAAPLYSNGKWDDALKKITWRRDIEKTDEPSPLPAFFFAGMGATPDTNFQTAHFGSVLLKDDRLLLYCLWHAGLNSRQTAECDGLFATIRPQDDLGVKVLNFRFSEELLPALTNAPISGALRTIFGTGSQ